MCGTCYPDEYHDKLRGVGDMEIRYEMPGPEGRQCQECKFFEPSPENPSAGKCFGHDVVARGTCNMFVAK